ncbi:MAG: diaminopimelate decarboxylase [Rikenellaceae bacterium]
MAYLSDKTAIFSTLKTPFYYYDMPLLHSTLKKVKEESEKYDFQIHYAVKANADDKIMRTISSYGFGADCVSGGEVKKALETGFSAAEVVYAGVGKTDDEINFAIDNNIFSFNCESLEELLVINQLAKAKNKVARVALRLNPEVDPQTHAYITTGKAENKFGISFGEIDSFLTTLSTLKNIHICGLHFHIGSQILQLQVFNYLCERVATFVEWFENKGIKIESINLGGGLGINYNTPDTHPIAMFSEYFKIFADNLKTLRNGRTIHFELGRSIVAQCGTLITRALYNKTTSSGKQYVIVDASMTELIRPALYGAHHAMQNISSSEQQEAKYDVAGGVCESSDIFAKEIMLPKTKRGDFLTLRSAGAYGISMASTYNLRPLPKSIYSDQI